MLRDIYEYLTRLVGILKRKKCMLYLFPLLTPLWGHFYLTILVEHDILSKGCDVLIEKIKLIVNYNK